MQQTPNPEAQVPADAPPLFEHSSLRYQEINHFWHGLSYEPLLEMRLSMVEYHYHSHFHTEAP